VLAEIDEDNSGGIDFEEFLKLATQKVSTKDSRADIQKVFNLYDWNKEGLVSFIY
jgi:Ca2+-binding EF-hand superfamily protein